MQNNLIEKQIGQLSLGEAQRIHNLFVYPLLAEQDSQPNYLTLDQALNARLARITEVSASGHVPELAFENLSDIRRSDQMGIWGDIANKKVGTQ